MQIKRQFKIRFFNDELSLYKGLELVQEYKEEPYIIACSLDHSFGLPDQIKIYFTRPKRKWNGFINYDWDEL